MQFPHHCNRPLQWILLGLAILCIIAIVFVSGRPKDIFTVGNSRTSAEASPNGVNKDASSKGALGKGQSHPIDSGTVEKMNSRLHEIYLEVQKARKVQEAWVARKPELKPKIEQIMTYSAGLSLAQLFDDPLFGSAIKGSITDEGNFEVYRDILKRNSETLQLGIPYGTAENGDQLVRIIETSEADFQMKYQAVLANGHIDPELADAVETVTAWVQLTGFVQRYMGKRGYGYSKEQHALFIPRASSSP